MDQRIWEAAAASGKEEIEMKGKEERRTDTLLARATLLYAFPWGRTIQFCFHCQEAFHQPSSHMSCWLAQAIKLFFRVDINLYTKMYPLNMLIFLINVIKITLMYSFIKTISNRVFWRILVE